KTVAYKTQRDPFCPFGSHTLPTFFLPIAYMLLLKSIRFQISHILHSLLHSISTHTLCAWLPVCHLFTPSQWSWPYQMAYEESCMLSLWIRSCSSFPVQLMSSLSNLGCWSKMALTWFFDWLVGLLGTRDKEI
ncbi:hypothetical protein V8G54_028561, partial [Vigna mungo]